MDAQKPANAADVRKVVEDRLDAVANTKGETVTIEWRGTPLHVPVISMPVALLHYNPDTHRVRAQRSTELLGERELDSDPFGAAAQNYLHRLLMGDPTDPGKVDPSFLGLKDDIEQHGQSDPGIITRFGVLINGNTRRAALKELGLPDIRVGVLPPDAALDDLQTIELALQLRKDHKRDYSFMNVLLAIEERVTKGQLPANIQAAFRIQQRTFERNRWILEFVRDAIQRSEVYDQKGESVASLRLVAFEAHQGKLEELYRAFAALSPKAPGEAAALREQRLLAIVLEKSKTDLRLIEPDFVKKYMPQQLPASVPVAPVTIPGLQVTIEGPAPELQALRQLTTNALQARSISISDAASPAQVTKAGDFLKTLDEALSKGLDLSGRQARLVKKRYAAVDRVSDACDDLKLATDAVADARSTGNFDTEDLEEILITLKSSLEKLSAVVVRDAEGNSEGIAWLRAIGGGLGEQKSSKSDA